MFSEMAFKEEAKPDFTTPNVILVQGLPGMGLVAKIAADFLIEVHKGKLCARLHSSYLPPIVRLKNGLGQLTGLEFYSITSLEPNLLLLTGDSQPADFGIMGVMKAVLDYSVKYGVTEVVAFGGLRAPEGKEVLGFAYTPETLDWISSKVEILDEGEISGAVGVLTAIAHNEYHLRAYGLLGKLAIGAADPFASKRVLQIFSELHVLKPALSDFDWFENKLQEIQKTEAQAQDLYKQTGAQFEDTEDESPPYYI